MIAMRPLLFAAALLPLMSGPALAALPLSVRVHNALPELRRSAPLSWSVPLAPEDDVRDPNSVALTLDGQTLPTQHTVLARWGGTPADTSKPIAWLLIDLQVDLSPDETLPLELVRRALPAAESPLRISRDDAQGLTVETGAASYTLSREQFQIFDQVVLADGTRFAGEGGVRWQSELRRSRAQIAVEHQGPQRISLRVDGRITDDLVYAMRLQFYRGLAEVRGTMRLTNLAGYDRSEFGQPLNNDYGSAGVQQFDDISLVFAGSGSKDFRHDDGDAGSYTQSFALVQESSGTEGWSVLRNEAPRLQSGARKRASTIALDGAERDGPNQLTGWLDSGGVTVAVEDFWQNFPKALRARDGRLEIGLFPREFVREHQLRSGEQKTHHFWVRHHAASADDVAKRARSALSPLRLDSSVRELVATGAAGLMSERLPGAFADFEAGLDRQLDAGPIQGPGSRTLLAAIDEHGMYGWVDWGDVPTDFEAVEPSYVGTPYNLKYDAIRGMAQQAIRSGDGRWWQLARAAAQHAADIDTMHSRAQGRSGQRYWADGGQWGHGFHNERGNTNPHRNYMNPNVEMAFAAPGILLYALLSGDTLLREDGLKLVDHLYWQTERSNYGHRCAASLQRCNGNECRGFGAWDTSRSGGNLIKAMLGAWIASGEADYLGILERAFAYHNCLGSLSCDRFHFQATFDRNLGHYILLRRRLGLAADTEAEALLRNRTTYIQDRLWNASRQQMRFCWDNPPLVPLEGNWLLAVADAVAVSAWAQEDRALFDSLAMPLFSSGARDMAWPDSGAAYFYAKEFVNQLGFGGMTLASWQHFGGTLPARRYMLQVTRGGEGGGMITSTPEGIDCGTRCGIELEEGSEVTLSAMADGASRFDGFEGHPDCEDGRVTLSADRRCIARFTPLPSHPLEIVIEGQGSVRSEPMGIDCNASCSGRFREQSEVVLRASPRAGWLFQGFAGDAGCDVGRIQMQGPMRCVARFAAPENPQIALRIEKTGPGSGRVLTEPAGIDCGATCEADFAEEAEVDLIVEPDASSSLGSFGGDPDCEDGRVRMDIAKRCTVRFEDVPTPRHELRVSWVGEGSGNIRSTPPGIVCGARCTAEFEAGTQVSLEATADPGSRFEGWSGDVGCGGGAPILDAAKHCVARFVPGDTVVPDPAPSKGGGCASTSGLRGFAIPWALVPLALFKRRRQRSR